MKFHKNAPNYPNILLDQYSYLSYIGYFIRADAGIPRFRQVPLKNNNIGFITEKVKIQ